MRCWRGMRWLVAVVLMVGFVLNGCRAKVGGQQKQLGEAKVVSAGVAPVPGPTRFEAGEEKSCREFVQEFYDWYIEPAPEGELHTSGQPDMDDAVRRKPGMFAHALYVGLKEDLNAQAHAHEIVGLDFDAFTGGQDNSPKFEVKKVTVKDGNCRATVWGVDQGAHRETVEAVLAILNGKWIFVDFGYPELGSTLMEQLRLNRVGREEDAKKKGAHR